MPPVINMEQNDNGQVILDDPFLGADIDEELENGEGEPDFGNEVDATAPVAKEEESEAGDDSDDAVAESDDDDAASDDEPADESDGEEASEDETPADDDGDEEEEEEQPDPQNDQRIPKKRFDEVNERRKLAEKKLAEREAADAAALAAQNDTFDFDAKEREYMELTVDGEFDKALEVRNEIRAAEKAQYERMTTETAQQTREQAKIDVAFQDTLADLEAQYPQFSDKENADFNQDLVDEVLDLHDGFLNKGYDPSVSIQKAVNYVAKANGILPAGEKAAAPAPKPTVQDKPTDKTSAKVKAKAKTTQPQQLPKGDGAPEPALDLSSMSEDEFDALPESKRRELRGDFG